MKICICEDDKSSMNEIDFYVSSYLNNCSTNFTIEKFYSGLDFLNNFEKDKFSIIFLDIYLGDILGIDIAHKIRALDEDVIIIFITSSIDYAFEGFKVNATNYLLKPISYANIEESFDRCKYILLQNKKSIDIVSKKSIYNIYIKDIIYIEIFNTTSIVHTIYHDVTTYTSLKKLESMLGGDPFLRCHRSYLVNMNYIKDISKNNFILNNKLEIPIKSNGAKAIKDKYMDFIFNSLRE